MGFPGPDLFRVARRVDGLPRLRFPGEGERGMGDYAREAHV